jgi:signal transduction histidine kinase
MPDRYKTRISLRFKLTLLIALLIAAAVLGVTFMQLEWDRDANTRLLGASQYALVTARAQEIDKALRSRIDAIETLANRLPEGSLDSVPAAQAWLNGRPVLARIFSNLFLVDAQGRVLASIPYTAERAGIDISDRPYFRRARDSRATIVSEPVLGRPLGQPQIVVAGPVYDKAGKFRGELLGVLDILQDDVLGVIAREKIGQTGYFAVIARDGPVLLSHPNATEVMLKGRAFNTLSMRAVAGWEGWEVGTTTRGERALLGYRQLKNAPWVVAAVMPTAEALAPLAATRQRTIALAFIVAAFAALLAWWLIEREARLLTQLRIEMERTASDIDYTPQLDTARSDELGALARSFTTLMRARNAARRKNLADKADLDTRLDARSRELAEQAAEMDTFLYTLGHDLRAPLRAVQGFAQMVAEEHGGAIGADGRSLLDRITNSGRHMSALVDGMLELGRISKTHLDMPLPVVEMNAIVGDVLRRNALPAEVFDTIPLLPAARGDVRLLRDVWGALLDNAVKFSAKVGRPRVVINARVAGGMVEYAISDNGVGFDQAYADSLFLPFSRLNAGAQYEGIGLGLAIARRALDKMGGQPRCVSTPGQGATFYFTLPAVHAAAEQAQVETAAERAQVDGAAQPAHGDAPAKPAQDDPPAGH